MLAVDAASRRIALVSEIETTGALAGFAIASVTAPEAELESIAVAAEFQRGGVARGLFEASRAGTARGCSDRSAAGGATFECRGAGALPVRWVLPKPDAGRATMLIRRRMRWCCG